MYIDSPMGCRLLGKTGPKNWSSVGLIFDTKAMEAGGWVLWTG